MMLRATARRLRAVNRLGGFDVVLVHRAACLAGPALVERVIARKKLMVFDFDDAIYLLDTTAQNRVFGRLKFPGKTAALSRMSRHVVAGNDHLARYAQRYNANVAVVPSSIDLERYAPKKRSRENGRVVIGWTGSATSQAHLEAFAPVLRRIAERHHVEVQVVSAHPPELGEVPATWRRGAPERSRRTSGIRLRVFRPSRPRTAGIAVRPLLRRGRRRPIRGSGANGTPTGARARSRRRPPRRAVEPARRDGAACQPVRDAAVRRRTAGRRHHEAATRAQDDLFRFKVDFVRRRALPLLKGGAHAVRSADDDAVVERLVAVARRPVSRPRDRELAVARAGCALLDREKAEASRLMRSARNREPEALVRGAAPRSRRTATGSSSAFPRRSTTGISSTSSGPMPTICPRRCLGPTRGCAGATASS